jgi:hypothetical protein
VALNRSAVWAGAVAAMPIVLPAVIANAWLTGQDDPSVGFVVLTYLLVLLGFVFAGFGAARSSGADTPLQHGAAGATAAWAVLQAISIVVRMSRGDGISPLSIVFTGLLAASAGVVGGLLATRVPQQERRT